MEKQKLLALYLLDQIREYKKSFYHVDKHLENMISITLYCRYCEEYTDNDVYIGDELAEARKEGDILKLLQNLEDKIIDFVGGLKELYG